MDASSFWREASVIRAVVSIKITLYCLAINASNMGLINAAAENGKEVTALFELRAQFLMSPTTSEYPSSF